MQHAACSMQAKQVPDFPAAAACDVISPIRGGDTPDDRRCPLTPSDSRKIVAYPLLSHRWRSKPATRPDDESTAKAKNSTPAPFVAAAFPGLQGFRVSCLPPPSRPLFLYLPLGADAASRPPLAAAQSTSFPMDPIARTDEKKKEKKKKMPYPYRDEKQHAKRTEHARQPCGPDAKPRLYAMSLSFTFLYTAHLRIGTIRACKESKKERKKERKKIPPVSSTMQKPEIQSHGKSAAP